MYKTVMIPVDLEHKDLLEKALATAADLAQHYGAELYAVGVTSAAPGVVAHNPSEYAQKLDQFSDLFLCLVLACDVVKCDTAALFGRPGKTSRE